MIRSCRLSLLGVLVVTLAAGTTVMMAAGAKSRDDADSVLSALLASPARPAPASEAPRYAQSGEFPVSNSEVAVPQQKSIR